MKEQLELVNAFYSSLRMGELTFKNYYNKARNENLKTLLKEIRDRLVFHEEEVEKILHERMKDPDTSMKWKQKLVLIMVENKSYDEDIYLILDAIDALSKAIKGGVTFLYTHGELDDELYNPLKEIVKDYDNLIVRLKKYIDEEMI